MLRIGNTPEDPRKIIKTKAAGRITILPPEHFTQ